MWFDILNIIIYLNIMLVILYDIINFILILVYLLFGINEFKFGNYIDIIININNIFFCKITVYLWGKILYGEYI